MKFKIISSLLIVAAIFAAIILSGGLDLGSTSSSGSSTRNDGIRINP